MIGTIVPVYIENITTRKDKTVKLTLGTQELSPANAGELFRLLGQLACCYISPKEIGQREIDQVDKLEPEMGGKTQSQRLRNVLYKMWDQNHEGYDEFNNYYHSKMDVLIEHFKSKLEPA